MALVLGHSTIKLIDGANEPKSLDLPFYTADTNTVADVIAALVAIEALLDKISDSQLVSASLMLSAPLHSGMKTSPVAGSDNEKTGLITYLPSTTRNRYSQVIPAFPSAKFSGNQVNFADADVSNWTGQMIGLATALSWSDRYGHALTEVVSGFKTFRKYRRALRRA